MAQYYQTALVRFAGYFPVDMLRRDRCWPANDVAVTMVGSAPATNLRLAKVARVVDVKNMPWTDDRWRSFGAEIVEKSECKI
jgi:hypothetical protein